MAGTGFLWVLVVAAHARRQPRREKKELLAATYKAVTVEAAGVEEAADIRVVKADGSCRTLAGESCAVSSQSWGAPVPTTLVLMKATGDCGTNGLWHFLTNCVNAAAKGGSWAGKNGRRAALAFVEHTGARTLDDEDPCLLAPFAERWRPFLAELFKDGVYASLACYQRHHPHARRYDRVAVVTATKFNTAVPSYFRDVGFAAFGLTTPIEPAGDPRTVLHLRREDMEGTLRAHRTLRNASVLENAFRRAGFAVEHCCDFRKATTAAVIRAVSRADVVVGMHGAALAHLTWHKPGATVVELFSHKMNGLWFYRDHVERYGSVFVGPARGRDAAYWRRRLDLDAATADRVVRCVRETAAGDALKPSCDVKPPKPPPEPPSLRFLRLRLHWGLSKTRRKNPWGAVVTRTRTRTRRVLSRPASVRAYNKSNTLRTARYWIVWCTTVI